VLKIIVVYFLGTGGNLPTKQRGLPSVVLKRKKEVFMFDCGEGTQLKFILSNIGLNKIMKIFISHLHGDHVFGLPGLLASFSFLGRTKTLSIYGPHGITDFLNCVLENIKMEITYKLEIKEIREGLVYENKEYLIRAIPAEHIIESYSFIFEEKMRPGKFNVEKAINLGIPRGPLWKKLQLGSKVKTKDGKIISPEDVLGPPRKGLKIVYSGDTRPTEILAKNSLNADLIIHDSTFSHQHLEKAILTGHSTCVEAAEIALKSNSKLLALFHISPRYPNPLILVKEAKKIFPNTILPSDGEKIELRYVE